MKVVFNTGQPVFTSQRTLYMGFKATYRFIKGELMTAKMAAASLFALTETLTLPFITDFWQI